MATLSDFTVTVKQRRNDGGSIKHVKKGDQDKLKASFQTNYLVTVTEADPPTIDPVMPDDINPLLLMTHTDLPVVNQTTYEFADVISPFTICRGKSIKRDPKNGRVFHVTCDWESDVREDEEAPISPPVALTDITPIVASRIEYIERPLYEDKDGNQCWKLPTGTPWSEPVVEKVPTLALTITQYEASITYEQMLARSWKTNSATYRTRGADSWLIGSVQATEAKVRLSGGVTTCAKVTYPIFLSEAKFTVAVNDEPEAGETQGSDYFYGWLVPRPLVDTYSIEYDVTLSKDVLQPIVDDETGYIKSGYIWLDGGQRTPGGSGGLDIPSYQVFRAQDQIDFGTFLQV